MGEWERKKTAYDRTQARRSIGILRRYFGDIEVIGERKRPKKVKNTRLKGTTTGKYGISWEQMKIIDTNLNQKSGAVEDVLGNR